MQEFFLRRSVVKKGLVFHGQYILKLQDLNWKADSSYSDVKLEPCIFRWKNHWIWSISRACSKVDTLLMNNMSLFARLIKVYALIGLWCCVSFWRCISSIMYAWQKLVIHFGLRPWNAIFRGRPTKKLSSLLESGLNWALLSTEPRLL